MDPKRIMLMVSLFAVSQSSMTSPSALVPLQTVLEHAIWRGWHQARIFTPHIDPGYRWALIRLAKCLSVNGVASTLNTMNNPHVNAKVGIVVLSPRFSNLSIESVKKLFKKLNDLKMNSEAYDWLITARTDKDLRSIHKLLQATTIRFDQNIIAAYPSSKHNFNRQSLGICEYNFSYRVNQQVFNHSSFPSRATSDHKQYFSKGKYRAQSYYRSTERLKNLTRNRLYKRSGNELPLFQAGVSNYNFSKDFYMKNVSKLSLESATTSSKQYGYENNIQRLTDGIHLVQYFKVRQNSTLYAHYLGTWHRELSMSMVDPPYPVEARNFLGEMLLVGRCNTTEGSTLADDEAATAPAPLDDVLHFMRVRLNAALQTRYYNKLGFRSYEGVWTGLLGGLMDTSVDIALEPVTAHPSQHHDMDFIFPIAETMCNIYIRHQETSTVRDIFLAPFSPRLVVSVVGMTLVAALAVVFITRNTPALRSGRPLGYTEALVWSTGILCQQGGTWTPPNPAGSILLIACLLFAVVTYNSYAAFITSVLSVRVSSFDTVSAVLNSPDFKIGYIQNGADQMYLMSTKDAQLNEFYIRGYSEAENLVSSYEDGLARAASQDYAFFAGQRAARSVLSSLSQARGRCRLRELPVHSTRADLTFPLSRHSPYAKPILLSLLQLRSSGALARLEAALVPAMPQCYAPQGFASARAADVRSALILLAIGVVAASIVGISEYCWKNRLILRKRIVKSARYFIDLIVDSF